MKKAMIFAVILIFAGCMILGGVMTMLNWDFSKLSTVQYETNTYEIRETFDSISVTTETADVRFVLSDDGTCQVECVEEENANHRVAVEDGTLIIEWKESPIHHIGINMGSPSVTVRLPAAEYGAVTVHVSTGSVQMEQISADTLELEVSTGRVNLTDITCGNLTATGGTGDLSLKNVIAEGGFFLERGTGDVNFEGCDAGEIVVNTGTGDVTGTFLTGKLFVAESSTGKVVVPETTTGGRCEVTTSTGDIKLEIK